MKSPEMSQEVAEGIDSKLDGHTYKVVLNEKGKIRWLDRAGEEEVVLDTEPKTSWWRRFTVGFYRILPIKSQL